MFDRTLKLDGYEFCPSIIAHFIFSLFATVGFSQRIRIHCGNLIDGKNKEVGMGDKIGSIESGKLADIIAVDENPVSNIKTMEKVNFVMKEGVVYKNGYTQIQVQGPRFKVKDRFQVSSPGFTCTSLLYFKLWTLDLEL